MHKLKHGGKKHRNQIELDPELIAAIDKTVEAAIISRMDAIYLRIEKSLKDFSSHEASSQASLVEVKPLFNPEAGP
jgi:hypothetical protein